MSEGFHSQTHQIAEGAETIESLRAKNEALQVQVVTLEAELVAERATKEDVLKKLDEAGLDLLTSLPLRRRFETSIAELFAHPLGPNEKLRTHLSERLALLFIDLDHFKDLNDRHGHPTGDRALHDVAHALKNGIRPTTDFIARWEIGRASCRERV